MLTGVLQQRQLFRAPSCLEADYMLLPDEDENDWVLTAINKTGESSQEKKLTRIMARLLIMRLKAHMLISG